MARVSLRRKGIVRIFPRPLVAKDGAEGEAFSQDGVGFGVGSIRMRRLGPRTTLPTLAPPVPKLRHRKRISRHRVIMEPQPGLLPMPLLHCAPVSPLPPAIARHRGRRLDVLAIAAAALVNERYTDRRFTLLGLAAELRVSVLLLRIRFRRFYGLSLDEHLALRRLELAAVMMASTPVALGGLDQIARVSGYRSIAELDRDHRRYHRTPALAAWFRASPRRAPHEPSPVTVPTRGNSGEALAPVHLFPRRT